MTEKQQRSKLSIVKKFIFGWIVAILVLVLFEFSLRFFQGPLAPDIQVHSMVGELDQWFVEEGAFVRPAYQSYPNAFPKEKQKTRVAFFGASSLNAGSPNVKKSEQFPELIGRNINVTTFNLAEPALDSHDILKILEEVQKYKFDVWVIYTGHNDFGNTYFFQRYKGWSAKVEANLQQQLSQLRIYRLLQNVAKPSANSISQGLRRDIYNQREYAIGKDQRKVAQRLLFQNIERMKWLGESAGVEVLFVIPMAAIHKQPIGLCPHGAQVCGQRDYEIARKNYQRGETEQAMRMYEEAWLNDSVPLRIPPDVQKDMRTMFTDKGYNFVDPQTQMPKEDNFDGPQFSLFHDHVHLSKQGHQEMANLVEKQLQQLMQE